MIKKFFFAAVLLPAFVCLAYAVGPSTNLSVQVIPAGVPVPPPEGIPAPAVAAGFTTLALSSDFTQPRYATQTNWLDCNGTGSPSIPNPEWSIGYDGFGAFTSGCANISQQVDPVGGSPALRLHWDDSLCGANLCGASGVLVGTVITTANSNHVGNNFPPNAYFEVVARFNDPTGPSNPTNTMDLWSFGNAYEWDGIEVYDKNADGGLSYFATVFTHPVFSQILQPCSGQGSNCSGGLTCVTCRGNVFPTGLDVTQYHKYAWRVTNDGVTDGFWCLYIDDLFINCTSWYPTGSQLTNPTNTELALNAATTCRGTNCGSSGRSMNTWIRSVRVFSCAGIAADNGTSGPRCFTATPNPPQEIVSSSTIPAPATAAGFTTATIDYDFSLPFYATNSNWLDCAGASSPQWYLAWGGFGSWADVCHPSFISQAVDPLSGVAALHLLWQDSLFDTSKQVNGITLQTCNSSKPCVGNHIPPNAYFEVTARYTPYSAHGTMDLWSYTIDGETIEWDGIEVYTSATVAGATMHNPRVGFTERLWGPGLPPAFPSSFDYGQYHRWAWRVTSNGTTDGWWCSYVDDQPNGCKSWRPDAYELTGLKQTLQILHGVTLCTSCPNGFPIHTWVSRVRVFSCDGLNSSSKCFTSSPNP